MPACPNGHPVAPDERFCLKCGVPIVEGEARESALMPPFDAGRFRDTSPRASKSGGRGNTVPLWILVVVVVLALGLGVVLGAVS